MKRSTGIWSTISAVALTMPVLIGCKGGSPGNGEPRALRPADASHGNPAALSSGPVVASGDAAKSEAALSRLIALQGEWEIIGADGKRGPGLSISVSSAGSAVREVMFAGSPHEMTNMYHADGGSLILTHYCAMGNQPRMRAAVPQEGQPFSFGIDSVTNLRGRDEMYMGSMVLTIIDANTIRQDWNHYTLNGGKSDDATTMTFKRKGT